MEIRQLKAFIAIAETKTFTAGARRLNITQAAISMQIQQLEKEIGLSLFTRTSRRVIITEAGECLLRRARRILREHDTAIVEIAEIAGSEYGRLRVGSASAMFATAQLPKILEALKRKFPKSEVTVSSGTSAVLVEKIMHNEIDVAFVSLPVENANILTETLFSDQMVAISHPSHPLAKKRSINAALLAKEDLILGEQGGNARRMIDEFFDSAHVRPNVVMELSRQEAINKMVENNMGVGISGVKYVSQQVKEGKLNSWKLEGADIKWDLGLARLKGGYFSPIAKEFVELCKESFADRENLAKSQSK
ncbi:MAG: LysR family transcriptional regulator [Pyrinomonadaceae bacterium]|nr:LysR family transcriptional regulator [Pyrinomonadaceae bacterium]